jgi:outer membrane cobalamin receptor
MFQTGFQSVGFQSVWGTALRAITGGHFVDVTGYRKQLEKMIKSAEKRDEEKYRKQAKQLIPIAKNAGVEPTAVKTVVEVAQKKEVDLDYRLIINELNKLLLEIERVAARQAIAIAQEREEEELILLLALS